MGEARDVPRLETEALHTMKALQLTATIATFLVSAIGIVFSVVTITSESFTGSATALFCVFAVSCVSALVCVVIAFNLDPKKD